MALRPILRLGHPALRTPAEALDLEELQKTEMQELINDMIETMIESDGVGLAAPQIGISLQLFVYDSAPGLLGEGEEDEEGEEGEEDGSDENSDGEEDGAALDPEDFDVLVNPMLVPNHGDLVEGWEGCLSIPDLRGLVPRHPSIRVQGYDRLGKRVDFVAEDFVARVIQHEFDHLNGVVFLDRMHDLASLSFEEEWDEFSRSDEDGEDASAVE